MADQFYPVDCGFFDAVDNDRLYTADQMNLPYRRFIGNGVFAAPDGSPSEDFEVIPNSGMNITVKAGEGMFAYKWFIGRNDINITVPSNTGSNSRTDSVVIQVDNRVSGRAGNIVYRTGGTSAPDINTDPDIVEYRLANVFVAINTSSIVAANITDLRGTDGCPWVKSLVYQPDNAARIDEFLQTYGVNNATRITETVLFSSATPVQNSGNPSPGILISADITSFDYVDIRYSAFGRTGIVRFKGSDIRMYDGDSDTGSHWSEFNRTSYIDLEDQSTPLEKVDFLLEKVDATHIWWQSQGWAWSGKADETGRVVNLSDTNNLGIFSVTGITYTNAGSTKDPELTDIRVGANGTTYATAGDAVRGQYNTIGNVINIDSIGVFQNGYFLTTVGSIVNIESPSSGAGWSYCIIPCKEGDKLLISAGAGSNPCQYAFLDANYKCISRSGQVDVSLKENNIVLAPDNSGYVLVNSSTTWLETSKRKLFNMCSHGNDITNAKNKIDNEIVFADDQNLRTIFDRKGSTKTFDNIVFAMDNRGILTLTGTASANAVYYIYERYNPDTIVKGSKYEIEVFGLSKAEQTALQLLVKETSTSADDTLLTKWTDGKYIVTMPENLYYIRLYLTCINGGATNTTITVNVRPVGADGIYKTSYFGGSLIRAVQAAQMKYGSTVVVDSGTIDLVNDFIDCYGESFFTSYNRNAENGWGIVLTNGVTIRGLSDSVLTCDPGQYQSSGNDISTYFSPLMLAGDCTIENLKIVAANTKYCVHDDWMDKTIKAKHVYKNCVMIKNDSLNRCLGGGFTNSSEVIIQDCYFKDNMNAPVSFHNCVNSGAQSRLVISGNYFENGGIRLANYGDSTLKSVAYIHGNSYKAEPVVVFEDLQNYSTENMEYVKYCNELRA